MRYYKGTIEILVLIATAIANSYWVDIVVSEPASIYIIGIIQTVTTVVVLMFSKLLYARRHRATMTTGGDDDGA